eukprot:scaffold1352_cov144-Cylindrotheca_fusiformis.AAC.1
MLNERRFAQHGNRVKFRADFPDAALAAPITTRAVFWLDNYGPKMDVEASSTEGGIRGRNSVMNPYSGGAQPTESIWHHVRSFQRGLYMGLCLYGLHHYGVYNEIMASPKVSHEWFKVALSASIGEYSQSGPRWRKPNRKPKGYVEMYAGKFQKRRVSYENFPQSTHSAILLIILSSVSYHVALWPVYGGIQVNKKGEHLLPLHMTVPFQLGVIESCCSTCEFSTIHRLKIIGEGPGLVLSSAESNLYRENAAQLDSIVFVVVTVNRIALSKIEITLLLEASFVEGGKWQEPRNKIGVNKWGRRLT